MQKKRFKILIVPGLIPYPPDDGGKLCIYCFIDYLRKFHEIHLLLSCYSYKDEENVEALRRHWTDVEIYSVSLFEARQSEGMTGRIRYLFKRLLEKTIGKLEQNIVKNHPSYGWFTVEQTTPFYPLTHEFIKVLSGILANHRFDIIQTELTSMITLINLFPPTAKRIFVQIEERSGVIRDFGTTAGVSNDYVDYVAGNTEFLEFSYMARYDAVFALNDSDRLRISQKIPNLKVRTSPYGLLDRDLINAPDFNGFKAENLIFIGSELHYPNVDALNWFVDDLVVKFKSRPFKKIYVTGRWSEATKQKLRFRESSLEFIGFVDDLSPYLRKSVSIVPIRIGGGGIRTKILTAMMHGTPVVSTTLGSVGIKGLHPTELLISNTADDFVRSIEELFRDEGKCRNMITSAYDLVKREYSQSHVAELRNSFYHEIVAE